MDKSSGLISDLKSQELKKKLLECLDTEMHEFSQTARAFISEGPLSSEDKQGLLKAIVATVDHVIASGDWNNSLFLRNTLKPLIAVKEEAAAELKKYETVSASAHKKQALAQDEIEIYISLFQSDGYNISKWAMQLRSLDRYIVGRPVYEQEMDVEKRIRLRASGASGAANEAYVVVAVKKTDIQSNPFQASLKDTFGHSLLSLKETAVRNGKIGDFVHQNNRYDFVDGQLIKKV